MPIIRFLFLIVVGLLLCVPTAFGSGGGGGVDGGGGGGHLVPSREESGPTLSKVYKKGVEFLTKGECKRAEKKFRRVLKKVPRNSEANYLLGVSLQCQHDHKSAVRYFKRAKRDDAQFYQAYEALGFSYLVLDRPDLAVKELRELVEFKELCEIGNRICPATLSKAHRKLLAAMERTGDRPVDLADGDQREIFIETESEP